MSKKKLQKSLQDYLSKIKRTSPNIQFPSTSVSSPKKWILKGCKRPRTLSFSVNPALIRGRRRTHDDNNDDAATLADVDRFLFENFKSLYIRDDDDDDHGDGDRHRVKSTDGVSLDSTRFFDLPLDLCGSNRFFVSTGSSSSIVEEAQSSAGTNTTVSVTEETGSISTSSVSINDVTAANDSPGDIIQNECIAVLRYSPSPYDDFRRSMQEMVEARLKHHSEIDWEFMEELVFCYLKLNDKKSHKFILRAFVDLVMDLRQNDMRIPAKSRHVKVNSVRDDTRSRRTRHNVML